MTAWWERACGCERVYVSVCVCVCVCAGCVRARGLPIFLLAAVSWELEGGRETQPARNRRGAERPPPEAPSLRPRTGAVAWRSKVPPGPQGRSVQARGLFGGSAPVLHLEATPDGDGKRLPPSGTQEGLGEGTMALTPRRGPSAGLVRPELWLLLWAAAWRLGATACPALCTCTGTTVDCHGTGLQAIPKNIPRNTERL